MKVAMPQPPSRTLTCLAVSTGVIAGALWTASLITFAIRQGEKMAPDEIRLALTALAFGAVTTALWAHWRRQRTRYQTFVDYVPFRERLDGFEERLDHIDRTVCDVNGRSLRLSKMLQEDFVLERPGEDTGELMSRARGRAHLRSVSKGARSNPA